jgi:hypothetical protein
MIAFVPCFRPRPFDETLQQLISDFIPAAESFTGSNSQSHDFFNIRLAAAPYSLRSPSKTFAEICVPISQNPFRIKTHQ